MAKNKASKSQANSDMFKAIKYADVDDLCEAVKNGADVNAINWGETGKLTPLTFACTHKEFKIIRLLIEFGANVNKRDKKGDTPLASACCEGSEDIVDFLIKSGADVNTVVDTRGPLYYACLYGHADVVRLLLDAGADVSKNTYSTLMACMEGWEKIVRLLLSHGADVNAREEDGNTLLHHACFYGQGATARLLLDHGADVSICNKEGKLAIDQALQLNNADPDKEEILELFRVHAPELYFSKFCTTNLSPGGCP